MDRKLVLDIRIAFRGETVHMKGENGEVTMIPFAGEAEGEIFRGRVEPCGVDTQTVNAAGVRHMSARYMLTGVDREGKACHIYVENDGWFNGDMGPGPFRTVPRFMTDSAALTSYLHRNQFIGEGSGEADGLHIRFYEIGHAEA